MPSWKKVITSGSNASLNSLNVINGITGSLQGTASNATNASYVNPLNQLVIITGSLIQGAPGNIASGNYSHAEGSSTIASGDYSHAEGFNSLASGLVSHAEGFYTTASGDYSHAEGAITKALGSYSHTEGAGTIASSSYSHAEGLFTVAQGNYQHVQGQYNISSSAQSAFIIGNGANQNNRSNLVFASGSQFQITGSLRVSGSITGSLQGTASFAISASYAPPKPAFPFTGSAGISGSLIVDGTIRGKLNRYNYATYRIRTFNIYVGGGFYGIANNPNYPGILVGENEPIYFYVDINDYSNGIEYRELSFATLTEINTFCGDQEIEDGEIVFYSYTNNTDTLRIGGSNTFSTIFGINKNGKDKILSNKQWKINPVALPQLRGYLTSSFMADMSSSIDNFEAEYLNRAQIDAICSATENIGRVYFDKYKERHLSRFYYGGNFEPVQQEVIGFLDNGDLAVTDQRNKLLSTTLCNMNRINDSIFTISTLRTTTTNGATNTGANTRVIESGPGTSLFHVYIFAGVNNTRILAIEPLSIDALTIPFPFRDSLPTIPNYKYKLKIGELFADTTLVRNDTNDDYNNLSPRPLVDSITVSLPSSAFRGKQTNIDIIRLYEDKTCDVFKQCARMVHTVYNRKTDSTHLHAYYMKLNK